MKRTDGVLMHVSSLWGEYSCGSFGKAAKEFIDFLADCGFGAWQVLPFGIPDDFNSPYKAFSAFAGNPYFIDLDILGEKGLLTGAELAAARQKTPYVAEFSRLGKERFPLLSVAAHRAYADPALAERIDDTIGADPDLLDFCKFMARRAVNDGKPWYEWTKDGFDDETFRVWKFIQYEFFAEWDGIHRYAAKKGVSVIGDIPIYMDYDSADVWAHPEEYQLDERKRPTAVAGVPPDYFAPMGQLWGNPLYRWDVMEKTDFRFWRARIAAMLRLFDGVRIDHFRAAESYWSVPAGDETAREGNWVKGPGMAFVRAIRETVDEAREASGQEKFIIAEDLGDIDDAVRELVKQSGFPGMRVLQFAFDSDATSPHLPHNYPARCVAYTGTHDNNTLLGFLFELSPEKRQKLLRYCGFDVCSGGDWNRPEVYDGIIRMMLASHADTVILPIQDLLHYGSDTRMNTPGRAAGNWEFRLTGGQLSAVNREVFREWAELYGR